MFSHALPDPDRHAEFYADVPMKRALAWVIDTVLITLLCLLIVPFTAFLALLIWPLMYLAVSFVYRVATLSNGSATPGMRIMSITFLTFRGEKFDPMTAFLHTLLYTACLGFLLPQIISAGLMLTRPNGQSLVDMVLGSVAINRTATPR